MATAMAAATGVTMVVVVATKTIAATTMAGGKDYNQLEGAVEETMVAAKVMPVETAMAMEMAMMTATNQHQCQCQQQRINDSNEDDMPGMCIAMMAVAAMLVVGGGESNSNR